MTRLALIPSPFVGAVSWRAVAETLSDVVALDYGPVSGPEWHIGAARRISGQVDDRPWIAVVHSGAGAFAPALADVSAKLVGFIFVDAALPTRGLTSLQGASPEFAERLGARTTAGLLAPWNTWFDVDPTERMIPDPAERAAFIDAQPNVPFAFLEAPCAGSAAWETLPSAYLQFSRIYAEAADKAETRGWPVHRLRAHHLAKASDPVGVSALLTELAALIVR